VGVVSINTNYTGIILLANGLFLWCYTIAVHITSHRIGELAPTLELALN